LGGVKRKSLASMEKSQGAQDTAQSEGSKEKKTKETKGQPQQRKQFAFLVPNLSDAEVLKSLAPLKAVTLYSASKALGVNAAIAAGMIRDLQAKNLLTLVGGFSGHRVWAVRPT
jgi:small subunit ribosomal protein S25e